MVVFEAVVAFGAWGADFVVVKVVAVFALGAVFKIAV